MKVEWPKDDMVLFDGRVWFNQQRPATEGTGTQASALKAEIDFDRKTVRLARLDKQEE